MLCKSLSTALYIPYVVYVYNWWWTIDGVLLCTLIVNRTYTLTSGVTAWFGKWSLIIIFLGILIFSAFTRLVSFGFRSLQSISRVLAAPGKGAKLLFLYVFRVRHVYAYLPVKSHSNNSADNEPAGPIKTTLYTNVQRV